MVVECGALRVDPLKIVIIKWSGPPLELETRSMVSVSTLYAHIQKAAVPMETISQHIVEEIVLEETMKMVEKEDIWSKSGCGMGSCTENRIDCIPYFKIKDQDAYIRGDTHRELFFH